MANHKRKSTLHNLLARSKREQATEADAPAPTKPRLHDIKLSDTTVELTATPRPLHATFTIDAHGHTIARVKASYRHSDGDHFIRFSVTASPSATNRQGTTDFHAIANLEDGQQAGTYQAVVIIIDYEDGKSVWLEGEDLTHCAHTIRVKGTGAQTGAPHIGDLSVSHSFEHGPNTYLVEALIDAHGDGLECIDLTFSAPTSSDTVDVQLVPATEGHYVGLLTISKGESGIWPLHHLVARGLSGESWDWTRGASPPVYALMQAGINVDALAAAEAPQLLHDDIFVPTSFEGSATPQAEDAENTSDTIEVVEEEPPAAETTNGADTPHPETATAPETSAAPEHIDHSTNYSLSDYVSDAPHDHIEEYTAVPDECDTADISPISTKMRTTNTAPSAIVPPLHSPDTAQNLTTPGQQTLDEPVDEPEQAPADQEAEPSKNTDTYTDEPEAQNDNPTVVETAEADTPEPPTDDDVPSDASAAPSPDSTEVADDAEGTEDSDTSEPTPATPHTPQQATATHDSFSEFAPADNSDAPDAPWQENEKERPHGLQADLTDPWESDTRDVEPTQDSLYDDPWANDTAPEEEPRNTLYDDPWADEREPNNDADTIDIRDGKVGTSRRSGNHPALPEHPNLPQEPKIVW